MEKARSVVVTTDNIAYITDFGYPLHKSCCSVLDGYIEPVHPRGLDEPFVMLVNDEGLLMNKPLNMIGSYLYKTHEHGVPIVGNIIIMKEGYRNGEPDIIGLSEYEAQRLMNMIAALPFGITRKEEE